MVPDTTLLTEKYWHKWNGIEDIPLLFRDSLNEYRHNPLNGCKNADRQFTRGLEAWGIYGFQIFNFAHVRLAFPNETDKKAYATTTEAESEFEIGKDIDLELEEQKEI